MYYIPHNWDFCKTLSLQNWSLVCRSCQDRAVPFTSSLQLVVQENVLWLWSVLIYLVFFTFSNAITALYFKMFIQLISFEFCLSLTNVFTLPPALWLIKIPFSLDQSFPSLVGISLSLLYMFWSGSLLSRVDPSTPAILSLLISKVYFVLMVFISVPLHLGCPFVNGKQSFPPQLFCLAASYCEKRQWLLLFLIKRREIPNTPMTVWFSWIWFLGSERHSY